MVDRGLKIPEIEIPFIPEVDATSWARSLKFRDELPRVLRLLPLAASGVEGKTHHNLLRALVLRELRHTPRDEARVVVMADQWQRPRRIAHRHAHTGALAPMVHTEGLTPKVCRALR